MAVLTTQSSLPQGITLSLVAAAGGGDSIVWNKDTVLVVRNGDASATTVTVVTPNTKYGAAVPDVALSVAAGATAVLGPFPAEDFLNQSTGNVDVTYSKVTSLTVAALSF